jgi:hypothetical protein
MKEEDILAEAAKMVLTDKVPEQRFVRGIITSISQTQYGMQVATFNGGTQYNPPQTELEVTLRIMVDYNSDENAHRILHSGRVLIMEDRLG